MWYQLSLTFLERGNPFCEVLQVLIQIALSRRTSACSDTVQPNNFYCAM